MNRIKKLYYLTHIFVRRVLYGICSPFSSPGSVAWLVMRELRYGGIQQNVPRNSVSPHDPRSKNELAVGGMTGGDRMLHHSYAADYSRCLSRFVGKNIVLAEFGILRGTGLAIWCDIFADARVIGFDIDLSHFRNNLDYLKSRGAFESNSPELHEYDQFLDNREYLRGVLSKAKIDVCIDDGLHSEATIIATLDSVLPHLAEDFVYIVEDNDEIYPLLRDRYSQLKVENCGYLTVLLPGTPGGLKRD